MVNSMTHFEIQYVKNNVDHLDATLEQISALLDDTCLSCDEPVGLRPDEFHEYVIVTDENSDYWFICEQCALPVIDPTA